jgi:anti-sigma B factor antagonist
MEHMEFRCEPSVSPDVTVFRFKGPFVLGTMFPVQTALRDVAVKGVIIDLTDVPYMDSAGLGALLEHWSHSQRAGYRFPIVGVTPRVRKIFEITRTDTVLPIMATQADAEAGFRTGAAR